MRIKYSLKTFNNVSRWYRLENVFFKLVAIVEGCPININRFLRRIYATGWLTGCRSSAGIPDCMSSDLNFQLLQSKMEHDCLGLVTFPSCCSSCGASRKFSCLHTSRSPCSSLLYVKGTAVLSTKPAFPGRLFKLVPLAFNTLADNVLQSQLAVIFL